MVQRYLQATTLRQVTAYETSKVLGKKITAVVSDQQIWEESQGITFSIAVYKLPWGMPRQYKSYRALTPLLS